MPKSTMHKKNVKSGKILNFYCLNFLFFAELIILVDILIHGR